MDRRITRILLPYLAIGSVWIILSDLLVQGTSNLLGWRTAKGLLYVLGTGLLLALLLRAHLHRQDALTTVQQQLFLHSEDLLCVLDASGRFQQVNPAWQTKLGWPHHELESRPLTEFLHPGDVEAFQRSLSNLLRGEVISGLESRYVTRDGSHRILSLNAAALPEKGLIFGIARDMTAQRAMSEQFQRAQRLESMARLAAGLAHDFKNLLTVIMAHAQLGRLEARPDDPLGPILDQINDAASKAARLADRLLRLGRPREPGREPFDLNEMLENLRTLLVPILREDVELSLDLDPLAGWVQAEQSQIEEVVTNLCMNARDALPRGGWIQIRTRPYVAPESQAGTGLAPGEYVMLEVRDNGVGIPPELKERVFEPFFTTKAPGQGDGLGLSTAYALVKAAGGDIHLESVPEVGSTFQVFLPRADPATLQQAAAVQPSSLPRGNETVLIVEDDPHMRAVLARMIGHQGYNVLVAAHSAEALQIAQQPRTIHLLVTDVILPGLPGPELARILRKDRPRLKVLYMSGYPPGEIKAQAAVPETADFMAKPIGRAELAMKIREILDRPEDPTQSGIS
jgi:two-component system cell cycle sensor histidine kinase/response regulator CckA